MPLKGERAMPEQSKYNSQNLVNLLPDWLVHFLWFLYEDIPPSLRGQCLMFELTASSDGQHIVLRQESPHYDKTVSFPCLDAKNATVAVYKTPDRITMRLAEEGDRDNTK